MSQIIRYNESDFEKISAYFNATLDKSIIDELLEIKKNNRFIKRRTPIRLKYKGQWNSNIDENLSNKDIFSKLITSNLNKLSDNNFEVILNDINDIKNRFNQLESINLLLIDLIFDKAIEENFYSEVYSKLFLEFVKNDSELTKYLVKKFEYFYNEFMTININNLQTELNYDDLCDSIQERNNVIGGFSILAYLFNFDVIDYDKIRNYLIGIFDKINKCNKNEVSIYIEVINCLFSFAGKKLQKLNREEFNDIFSKKIHDLSNNKDLLLPKYRFKILDLLELIDNNWN